MSAPSRLGALRSRISCGTWIIILILSLRGLLEFYGMKSKGNFEQGINFVSEPLVQLSQFNALTNIDIPAISTLFAVVSILLASHILQLAIKISEYNLQRIKEAKNIRLKAFTLYLNQNKL